MGWTELSDQERAALLARAKLRHLDEQDLSTHDDLVVKDRGLTLDRETPTLRPKLSKPRSFVELAAMIGPPAAARKQAPQSELRLQRERLKAFSREIRPTRGRASRDAAKKRETYSNLAARMVINGVFQEAELVTWDLHAEVLELLQRIDVRQWLLPSIVVKSGATLSFNGAGVHSVVAYRLTVEPGARILINQAAVTFDCVHLVVQ